jgi:hypothetical protein
MLNNDNHLKKAQHEITYLNEKSAKDLHQYNLHLDHQQVLFSNAETQKAVFTQALPTGTEITYS